MNLKNRVEDVERSFALESTPLTREEYIKWFLMVTERQGAGHATLPVPEYTEKDWQWFEDHEEDFEKTCAILRRLKKPHR